MRAIRTDADINCVASHEVTEERVKQTKLIAVDTREEGVQRGRVAVDVDINFAAISIRPQRINHAIEDGILAIFFDRISCDSEVRRIKAVGWTRARMTADAIEIDKLPGVRPG